MAKNIGQAIVIHNVPGASTQVASRKVPDATPDGYTLYVSSPFEIRDRPGPSTRICRSTRMKDFTLVSFNARLPYLLLVSAASCR